MPWQNEILLHSVPASNSNITAILLQCWMKSLRYRGRSSDDIWNVCWPRLTRTFSALPTNVYQPVIFYFILNFICFLPRRDQSNWVLWLFLGSVNATEAWLYDQSDRCCAKTENPPHFIVRQLEFNLSYHYLEWSRKKRGTILRRVLKQALRPSASCLPYCSSSPQTASSLNIFSSS